MAARNLMLARWSRRAGRAVDALVAVLPWVLAVAALLAGCALIVVGVDMLFGEAWAYIAAAVPVLGFGLILLRGLTRG